MDIGRPKKIWRVVPKPEPKREDAPREPSREEIQRRSEPAPVRRKREPAKVGS